MFDDVLETAADSFKNLIKRGRGFKNIMTTIKAMYIANKSQVELQRVELNRKQIENNTDETQIKEEENFFNEVLNVKIRTTTESNTETNKPNDDGTTT